MTPKELREERANIIANARKKHEEATEAGIEMTAEELTAWDAQMSDAADLLIKAERLEKLEKMEASLSVTRDPDEVVATHVQNRAISNKPTVDDRDKAFHAWVLNKSDQDVPEEFADAAERCGVKVSAKEFKFGLSNRTPTQIRNAQSGQNVTTAGDGGYLVPEGFVNSLEAAMLEYGGILEVADVLRTSSGNDLPWPMVNDTGNIGALLAEDIEVTQQDIAFTSATLNAYKYTSKLMLVSQELLEDSAFNIPSLIGTLAGERLGRVVNLACTTGTGSSQPQGCVTGAATGKVTAGATAITTDEIKDLKRLVDPSYRRNAKWMFSDTIAGYIMKLKDGQSNYIWEENFRSGDPDRLLGHEVVINQDMSSTLAIDEVTGLFGDFSKLKIRVVNDVRLYRMQERYREFDQDGFVAFMRFDSRVLNAGGNPIKSLAQAAA